MNTIANLENFGMREIEMAADLMKAYCANNTLRNFSGNGVTVAFNEFSGDVFLTNDEFQSVMLDDDGKLYIVNNIRFSYSSAEDLFADFENGNINIEEYHALLQQLRQRRRPFR